MPVYTYRCENCNHQFEQYQKFTDQPLTRCPECGLKSLRKVYSAVGIVFKGSGFYSTDNRSPSGAPRGSSSKSGDNEKPVSDKGSEEKTPPSKTETPSPGSNSKSE